MKLEKLSAIAEIVSSVAIVITLGYLAIQTQQNTSAIRAGVRQGMLAEETQVLRAQMDYPFTDTTSIDERELTQDQRTQATDWFVMLWRGRENHWLQYRAGVIDEETWEAYRLPLLLVLRSNFYRSLWESSVDSGEFDRGFMDDVYRYQCDAYRRAIADGASVTPKEYFDYLKRSCEVDTD